MSLTCFCDNNIDCCLGYFKHDIIYLLLSVVAQFRPWNFRDLVTVLRATCILYKFELYLSFYSLFLRAPAVLVEGEMLASSKHEVHITVISCLNGLIIMRLCHRGLRPRPLPVNFWAFFSTCFSSYEDVLDTQTTCSAYILWHAGPNPSTSSILSQSS